MKKKRYENLLARVEDDFLVSQIFPDAEHFTPEKFLWLAVIQQVQSDLAVKALETARTCDRNKRNRIAKEAREFLLDEGDHIRSFNWCCEQVGLEPGDVRKRFLTAYGYIPPQLEHF